MKFRIELRCQNCGYTELDEKSYAQKFTPMRMKLHKCDPEYPLTQGVMLPVCVIKENHEPEAA